MSRPSMFSTSTMPRPRWRSSPRKLRLNEHGVLVSDHVCDTCGKPFSVTAAVDHEAWGGNCLDEECPSYDVDRDVDLLFGIEPWKVKDVVIDVVIDGDRVIWWIGKDKPKRRELPE